jgi:hypothetical protein
MGPHHGLDVTEPLVELSHGLDEAFNNPGDKQLQLAAAFIVIARFLSKAISAEHAGIFHELSSAFANLGTGAIHPWLKPSKYKPRHDPSQLWRARASAVVALEALHEAGTPLETAARELLRRHKGIALLGGGKLKHQAGISTLLTWRKQFSSGRVGDFEANELFSAGRELIRKFSGDVAKLHRIADDRARSASAAGGVFAPHSNTP